MCCTMLPKFFAAMSHITCASHFATYAGLPMPSLLLRLCLSLAVARQILVVIKKWSDLTVSQRRCASCTRSCSPHLFANIVA